MNQALKKQAPHLLKGEALDANRVLRFGYRWAERIALPATGL